MTDFFIPPDFDFGQQFDRLTLTRAMALDPERALLSMQIDGPALLTRLRGSGASAYEQRIELPVDRLGLRVRGHCSCPMGLNCKHVAAALMAFEVFQIRRQKDPGAPPLPSVAQRSVPAAPVSSGMPARLPQALLLWLAELAHTPSQEPPASDAAPLRAATSRRLMYVLRPQGAQLQLQLHLGTLRKNGEIGSHRRHASAVADMLRIRPSYLADADPALLAALLPLPTLASASTLLLRGRAAAPALRALVDSGRAWWLASQHDALPAPPGPCVRWSDDVMPVSLQWHADAAGQWRTGWRGPDDQAVQLVLLPEAHVFDPVRQVVQPARVDGAPLGGPLTDWLARMPAVPTELLPVFAEQLQSAAAGRHLALPLPRSQAGQMHDLGGLRLEPVLRLGTCLEVASEALLHESYGSAASRLTRLRQASVQLLFRYRPPGGAAVEFHAPASGAATAFVDVPGQSRLLRFERDAPAEADALHALVDGLGLRPWSVAAGLALDRIAHPGAGRTQAAAPLTAHDGKPPTLVLVPRQREQWPALLSHHVPALQKAGWQIETDDDFPFETHRADDWELSVAEEPGHDWFGIGLKVTVEGRPVDLVPLLIGLVQSGWLDAPLAEPGGGSVGAGGEPSDDDDDDAEVLVPWPSDDAPVPGRAPRQRLLRLPRRRVAPLMDWLRTVFRRGDSELRISRFDIGTLQALSQDATVKAPPSFVELMTQLQALHGGQGLPPVAPSTAVHATLRHYQQDGLAWMDFMRRARLGGVLADDMGLGKTLQTLALLQGELDAGRLDRPSLVIVPTSLLGNWQAEAARFTPQLEVLVLHGPRRTQDFARIVQAHLVVTSYPLAVRDLRTLAAQPWHYLVLDEAQRIKNSRSQAALAVKTLRARHRLGLSGTPLENHLGELWSLMDFVCPGLLGSEAQFREHYRAPIEKRHDDRQAESLARRVRPFILRRTKQQVARELPAKTETLLRVELAGAQADLYETVRATMDEKLRDAIARQGLARSQIMVLDALLKLRQVCCDPRLLKDGGAPGFSGRSAASAKMELLLDLLPTLVEDGRRVLLFSQFTEMLALIEPELARLKLPYLKLTGDTRDRAGVVAEFQQGDAPIFLISLKAGGVGLNLTAADTVILYDPWWNPAVEQQAIDRAYRIGQDKPVFVYKLVASATVEDKMLEMQARKAGLADQLLSGVASDAALDAEDFDELFKPLGSA